MNDEPSIRLMDATLRLVFEAMERQVITPVATKVDLWDECPAFEKRADAMPENNMAHG